MPRDIVYDIPSLKDGIKRREDKRSELMDLMSKCVETQQVEYYLHHIDVLNDEIAEFKFLLNKEYRRSQG